MQIFCPAPLLQLGGIHWAPHASEGATQQDGVGELQEADLSPVFLSSIFCLRVSILMYF